MSRRSLRLLTAMPAGEVTYTTPPLRGPGWYGPVTGLTTIAVRFLNFQGRLTLEGSLAVAPGDADWFPLPPGASPYIQFPRRPILDPNRHGETGTIGFTFRCNCLWLRAVIDRSYLVPTLQNPQSVALLGTIDNILVNY